MDKNIFLQSSELVKVGLRIFFRLITTRFSSDITSNITDQISVYICLNGPSTQLHVENLTCLSVIIAEDHLCRE